MLSDVHKISASEKKKIRKEFVSRLALSTFDIFPFIYFSSFMARYTLFRKPYISATTLFLPHLKVI